MDIAALGDKLGAAAPMPTFNAEPVPGRRIHVDGDYAAYYCSGKDGTSPGIARNNILDRITALRSATGGTEVLMHLTHGLSDKGLRYLIAESRPYQGQRDAGRKPGNWDFLREYMETYEGEAFTPVIWSDREADDGMAYYSHNRLEHTTQYDVVHTRDKDMRMFAGLHCDWMTFAITKVPLGAYDVVGSDGKQYGHKWFWLQMLTGDGADHIPGIPKWGEVKAQKLLEGTKNNEEALKLVSDVYRLTKREAWADYFCEQAALLWMRTDAKADLTGFVDVLSDTDIGQTLAEYACGLANRVKAAKASLPVPAWSA